MQKVCKVLPESIVPPGNLQKIYKQYLDGHVTI